MELREKFRAPFLEMAWQRQKRVEELLAVDGTSEVRSAAAELHCLSGEASMLDFEQVAALARRAEDAARQGDRPRLLGLAVELRRALEAVEREGTPG